MEKDDAMIQLMMTNFQRHQLERVLDIKQKVDGGGLLADYDRDFLNELCQEALDSMRLVEKFPEYQNVFAQAIHLYKEITDKALENERE